LSVQPFQLSEVADLRWDAATELIRGEVTERCNENIEDASYSQRTKRALNHRRANKIKLDIIGKKSKSESMHSVNGGRSGSERTAIAAE